jgi:hypothetical protein
MLTRVRQLFRKIRQAWRGEDSDAAISARSQYELQQALVQLNDVLRQLNLQPGVDYTLQSQAKAIGISLQSPRANTLIKSHPAARAALDRVMSCLGAIDGRSGLPCRVANHPAYVLSWKKCKDSLK